MNSQKSPSARVIAFYLPQYHPIPINDRWWGKGFTEWTSVARARPLFRGHHQPKLPGELGFYDLRVPEVREQQAELASEHGIEGFCYWHYWLGNGKRLLERPFTEVVKFGRPDFPFCLGWANHDWTTTWCGGNEIIQKQLYPGREDYEAHFFELLPAFQDDRWIRVDDKLLFLIFRPYEVPDLSLFTRTWQKLAGENGLSGFHFVGSGPYSSAELNRNGLHATFLQRHRIIDIESNEHSRFQFFSNTMRQLRSGPAVYPYEKAMQYFVINPVPQHEYPCIIPNWDNTPRMGNKAVVLKDSTPDLFRRHVQDVISKIQDRPPSRRIVFLKSWNEWAEGNYIEPDMRFGRAYLEALREVVVTNGYLK